MATKFCKSHGLELVSIETKAENDAIRAAIGEKQVQSAKKLLTDVNNVY
jgi:hypothetical protein